jgi:Protein of unknown function (DUF5818)
MRPFSMRPFSMRPMLFVSLLLLAASWAIAQNAPAQTDHQAYNQSATSSGSQVTVQGCLSGSDGKYMLTDDQGKMYNLGGDTSKLADHIGHEVKITGTESAASGASAGAMSSQPNEPTLEVISMKHISKTCKNGAMSH